MSNIEKINIILDLIENHISDLKQDLKYYQKLSIIINDKNK